MLQWSHVFSDMVREPVPNFDILSRPASMEPCLFRHGKGDRTRADVPGRTRLQWSHVFSDMVSGRLHHGVKQRVRASMEPCLFRHGKRIIKRPKSGSKAASMEPCLFRHGKPMIPATSATTNARFNGAMSFQTW